MAKLPATPRSTYEVARSEADAVAAKWHPGAQLYRVGLSFHARGNQSHFEYFFPDRPGRWSSLTVNISPIELGGLTTIQYALTGPLPVAVPDTLLDPLAALDKLGPNFGSDLTIGLTRVGESTPTIYGFSRTALEQAVRPGQWVWYLQTGSGGGNKLIYIDALTGQGAAVCWTSKGSFDAAACPVSK
jgi:hypothetical protein